MLHIAHTFCTICAHFAHTFITQNKSGDFLFLRFLCARRPQAASVFWKTTIPVFIYCPHSGGSVLTNQSIDKAHSSCPISWIVDNMACSRSFDGFLSPRIYCANRLCWMPILRATAEALISGCVRNRREIPVGSESSYSKLS